MTILQGKPECGSEKPHNFHTFITQDFDEKWCHGLCDCGMNHYPNPHGPGEHK